MFTHRPFVAATLVLLAVVSAAAAHEGLHEQIARASNLIERNPLNAALYLKRGELYRLHRDWKRALTDYSRAAELEPKLIEVELARGLLYADRGLPEQSKLYLDRFLHHRPDNVEALVARARVLGRLSLRPAAVNDYTRAIVLQQQPKPEFYIERAQALAAEGASHYREAIAGLDEGIKKLGPVVTLELTAIDLELKQNRYEAALSRLDRVMAQSPRKEAWLARKGDILKQAGQTEKALQTYQAAIEAIESLPARVRRSGATTGLEARIRSHLQAASRAPE